MESPTDLDITSYSFDEFVSFVFAHDVAAEHETQWYWKAPDVTFAPQQVCAYYVRLFRNPEFLLERFSKPQLEQGFWAIPSGIDWGLQALLWETEIPFPQRKECVIAMFDLFSRFFATELLEGSSFMWWDAICYVWHCGQRVRERGGEDLEMQDVMFQTISAILSLDSPHCQKAALHGLGHLHHPETQTLVQRYIETHPSLTEPEKEYALAAAKFKVL
jgi:hypothetical protein